MRSIHQFALFCSWKNCLIELFLWPLPFLRFPVHVFHDLMPETGAHAAPHDYSFVQYYLRNTRRKEYAVFWIEFVWGPRPRSKSYIFASAPSSAFPAQSNTNTESTGKNTSTEKTHSEKGRTYRVGYHMDRFRNFVTHPVNFVFINGLCILV